MKLGVANVMEHRATTMRMIATELESGSDRARTLPGPPYGVIHWLRIWADEMDPPQDDDSE